METTGRYNDNALTSDMSPLNDANPTVAAVFADRDRAHDAVHQLHDEGFRDTWIGLTRSDDTSGYAPMGSMRSDVATTPAAVGIPGETAPAGMNADYDALRTAPDTGLGMSNSYASNADALSATDADSTRVESDNWFTRFFGEGDESLHDALVRHGVNEADARAAGSLPAHSAILTVDGANHPELAAQIITQTGGRLITRGFGATGYGTSGSFGASTFGTAIDASPTDAMAATPSARTTSLYDEGVKPAAASSVSSETPSSSVLDDADRITPSAATASIVEDAATSDATAYDDYGRYRAGTPVDESTRLQLREERLRIDKSRISRGEATVGTEVVSEQQDIDVPFTREELFIERRPASGSTVADATPIGGSDVIRVPLTEEQVNVTKVPVVTEEVVVGKRSIQDTEHISETTRREQLNVNDVTSTPGTRPISDSRV